VQFNVDDFKEFINNTVSIGDVAAHFGIIPTAYKGNYRSQNIFCPIHHNINTPHAKLNVEDSHIYCFLEHRRLTPYYLLRTVGKLTVQQLLDHYGPTYTRYKEEIQDDPDKEKELSIIWQSKEKSRKVRLFIDSLFLSLDENETCIKYKEGEIPFLEFSAFMDHVLFNNFQGYSY